MNSQQVTAIALRVISIWLLIEVVLNLPSLFLAYSSIEQYQQKEMPLVAYIGLTGSFLLIGIVAVFLINKAAKSVLSRAQTDSESSLSNDSQKALFQLAGLYFVVDAIVYLPRSLGFIPNTAEISVSSLLWAVGLAFQLAVGLWLVTNSSFWLKLFQKLRGRA
ncbi:hypothetical protein KUV44_17580 [Marinobacter daepoensis]|uniref:DUF2975 domain-containing protein n=1 Tax=Marinobacter daepoensis TaxID=262077 RepID=A0ABS3BK87_9GAMM|nr:hypothetical protein [Marinobacter daepoensis]MBN7770645.1 hypothetical protein [Marinobacter daepoensis]MBY6080955.1 hypothetical protein [Marinobacter daepoensis]